MKGLHLVTVVFGLTCLSIYAYPVWNEQKNKLEDTVSYFDYNAMKDTDLFAKLIRNENDIHKNLRDLARNLDGDTMNFLGTVQSINNLTEEAPVAGILAEKLGFDKISAPTAILAEEQGFDKISAPTAILAEKQCFGKISAPTAIYVYQIMFSEENESSEDIGKSFDEYVKGMISNPFEQW